MAARQPLRLTSVSHAFSLLNFCDVNVRSEFCELTLVLLKHFIEWSFLVTVYETGEVANLAFELHFTGRSIALNYGPVICISFFWSSSSTPLRCATTLAVGCSAAGSASTFSIASSTFSSV